MARRAILGLMLADASQEWHLREIARRTSLSPATAHAEVGSLVAAGILARRVESRRTYYRANTACSIYPELHSIVLKTVGLVDVLRGALAGLPGIEVAFVYGSVARGEETAQSDVDLMLIGEVTIRSLAGRLRTAQDALSRPVNPTTYPVGEFREKLAEHHYFLAGVMEEPKLFVIGDVDVLGRLAQIGMGEEPRAQPPRGRGPVRHR
ncbi:MAG: helix-turn-helix domain-containing protein [Armatimonadota bacterium]